MEKDVRNLVLRNDEQIIVNEHEGVPCGVPFTIRAAVRGARRNEAMEHISGTIARFMDLFGGRGVGEKDSE
jgi:hypothetical protein